MDALARVQERLEGRLMGAQ